MMYPNKRLWLVQCSLIAFMLIMSSVLALGAEEMFHYSVDPILRPGTKEHTAQIKRISIDRQQRFIVSASTDKTARVWDLETGRLLRVLRVPQGTGHLGEIYAVAFSPDGKDIAVAGWTGGPKLGGYAIYIFNRETGQIRHRIGNLPTVITHLAFSHNGQLLAVTFVGTHGIRVFDSQHFTLIAKDDDYEASSYWADFDKKSRLVTASYDGLIRLYEDDYTTPKIKHNVLVAKLPYAVAFSPDGQRVALGYRGSDRIDILSGISLEPLFHMHSGLDEVLHTDSTVVAWSTQGDLYTGGGYSVGGLKTIRRWTEANVGEYAEFKFSNSAIIDLIPLTKGRFAVAGLEPPILALLNSEGQLIWKSESLQANFKGQVNTKGIRVSDSGNILAFYFDPSNQQQMYFDIKAGGFVVSSQSGEVLNGALTVEKGLNISNWLDSDEPKLNGVRLMLNKNETSRSLAIIPNGQKFLIGADWTLRLFDRTGQELDRITTPGAVWSLVVTKDGQMVIAGLGDGTLRWYSIGRNSKLTELFAFFPQKDQRWVVWTPEGYYQASINGAELIGWHVNRGRNKAGDFFSINRFRERFYRPDVIAELLTSLDIKDAVHNADHKNQMNPTEAISVSEMLPPVINILPHSQGNHFSSSTVNIRYQIRTRNANPVTEVKVMLNTRPLSPDKILSEFPEQWKDGNVYKLTIKLPHEDVTLDLVAMNEQIASEAATINLKWQPPVAADGSMKSGPIARGSKLLKRTPMNEHEPDIVNLPDLYILAIGASDYPKESGAEKLNYASTDAKDLMGTLLEQKGRGLYNKIHPKLLVNPTRQQILDDGLDWLEDEVKSTDIAIVFLAGHGYTEKRRYYFLPIDAKVNKLRSTALNYSALKQTMSALHGKVLFFVDTCHASQSMGGSLTIDLAAVANDFQSTENGIIVFTASERNKSSYEHHSWKNGAFTEALLEGLRGKAARKSKVGYKGLDYYLSWRVPELVASIPPDKPGDLPKTQRPGLATPKPMTDFPIVVIP